MGNRIREVTSIRFAFSIGTAEPRLLLKGLEFFLKVVFVWNVLQGAEKSFVVITIWFLLTAFY